MEHHAAEVIELDSKWEDDCIHVIEISLRSLSSSDLSPLR